MGEPARMPKLAEENASLGVHSLHYGLPSKDLLLRPKARDVRISDPSLGCRSGFSNEEPALSCALSVVDRAVRLWDVARRPAPGQWRMNHPAHNHTPRCRSLHTP